MKAQFSFRSCPTSIIQFTFPLCDAAAGFIGLYLGEGNKTKNSREHRQRKTLNQRLCVFGVIGMRLKATRAFGKGEVVKKQVF